MKTFSDLEVEGWNRNAPVYDRFDLPLTGQGFPAILEEIGELRGRRVLELACGTGHLAAAMVARGAEVVGLDPAPQMVELARRTAPEGARFDLGEAERLPFEDGSFDFVVSNCGFLHFGDPDAALREATRVLRPGGRLAFTVWQSPDRGNAFLGLLLGTMQTHGHLNVDLPPAPPIFGLADPETGAARLKAAGFTAPAFREAPVAMPIDGEGVAFDFLFNGGVRSRMIYEAQSPEAQAVIKDALHAAVADLMARGETEIACPMVLAAATKPA